VPYCKKRHEKGQETNNQEGVYGYYLTWALYVGRASSIVSGVFAVALSWMHRLATKAKTNRTSLALRAKQARRWPEILGRFAASQSIH